MAMSYNKDLFVVGRDSVVEARRMLDFSPEADVFLVGRGLMLPVAMFAKNDVYHDVYALKEEAEAMGLGAKEGKGFHLVTAEEMIDIILDHKIVNFT